MNSVDLLMWVLYRVTFLLVFVTETQSAVADAGENKQNWRHVKRWFVEAESETLPVIGKKKSLRSSNILARRIVIATSDDRLTYFVGHPDYDLGIDWQNEPFNVDIKIRDEKLIKHYKFNRMLKVNDFPREATIPDPIRRDILFFFLPIWPLQGYPAPRSDSEMIFVVGAAIESENYEVTSERELINQEWCKLVRSKSGNDRIWISEEKDLCVMRRQWYTNQSRTLLGELVAKEIREMAPGLWMPVKVEMTYYSIDSETKNLTPVTRTLTRVLQCEVDKAVPLDAHKLMLRPGTIEINSSGGINQLSSGGSEHITEIADFYRDKIGLPRQPPISDRLKTNALQMLIAALGGYFFGSIVLQWYRPSSSGRGENSDGKETDF